MDREKNGFLLCLDDEEVLLRCASGLKGVAKGGWNTRTEVIVEGIEEGIEEGIVAGIVEGNVEVVAEGVAGGIAGIYQLVENYQFIVRRAAFNLLWTSTIATNRRMGIIIISKL